jgi:hypothetical protein
LQSAFAALRIGDRKNSSRRRRRLKLTSFYAKEQLAARAFPAHDNKSLAHIQNHIPYERWPVDGGADLANRRMGGK